MKASTTGEKELESSGDYSSPLEEIKKWRSVFYKLAWLGFSPPDESLMGRFGFINFLEGMIEVSDIYGLDTTDSISTKSNEIEKTDQNTILKEISREYVRLFVADVGGARVQPYGSIYIDGVINGKSTRRVVDAYCRGGFEKSENYYDLPDRFSVELEYMYRLSQAERSDRLTLQRDFYDTHLYPWYEDFTSEVRRETEHWFYDILSRWTRRGLKKDRLALGDILTGTRDERGGRK